MTKSKKDNLFAIQTFSISRKFGKFVAVDGIDLLKHIMRCPLFRSKWRQHSLLLITSVILISSMLVGCGPSPEDLEAVEYTPLPGDDWKVSTPAEQGLDPMLVAELYYNAAELETLYGLLVIKSKEC